MPTTYRRTATDSDLGGGSPFNKAILDPASDSTGSDSPSIGAGASATARAFTGPGVPGAAGITGTYSVEVEVTSGNTAIQIAVQLHRVNSAGTVQSSSSLSAEQQATAGTKTFTFSSQSLGTWAAGDRLRVDYRFRSTASHGNSSITISHGGANNEVVAPWATATNYNETGLDFTITATVEGSDTHTVATPSQLTAALAVEVEGAGEVSAPAVPSWVVSEWSDPAIETTLTDWVVSEWSDPAIEITEAGAQNYDETGLAFTITATVAGDDTHTVVAPSQLEASVTVEIGHSNGLSVPTALVGQVLTELPVEVALGGALDAPEASVPQLAAPLTVQVATGGVVTQPTATVSALAASLSVEVGSDPDVAPPSALIPSVSAPLEVAVELAGDLDMPTASVPGVVGSLDIEVSHTNVTEAPEATVPALSGGIPVELTLIGVAETPTASVPGISSELAIRVAAVGELDIPTASVPVLTGGIDLHIATGGEVFDPEDVPRLVGRLRVRPQLGGELDVPAASVPGLSAGLHLLVDLTGDVSAPVIQVAGEVPLEIAVGPGHLSVPTPVVPDLSAAIDLEVALAAEIEGDPVVRQLVATLGLILDVDSVVASPPGSIIEFLVPIKRATPIARLFTKPLILWRTVQETDGGGIPLEDSWGNPITRRDPVYVKGYYRQIRTGDQDSLTASVVFENIEVFLPANTPAGPYDAVELIKESGQHEMMEVVGQPAEEWNARVGEVNHLKMLVRRAAP